jgi:hypothetical protein
VAISRTTCYVQSKYTQENEVIGWFALLMESSMCKNSGFCREERELNVEKLCSEFIKANCIKACNTISDKICSQAISSKGLSIESGVANTLCVSDTLSASKLMADMSSVNTLCARNATLNTACIDTLNVGVLNSIVKWKAAVTISANMTYTLGSNVDWNVILDDPNGNVILSPFSYTVPVSGYYSLSYYINSDSLAGAAVVSGIPVGLLTVTVNGSELRQFQSPYLSFSVLQKANLSSLVLLKAGDIVRMKYDVLVFDSVLGLVPYVGTVSFKGNGLFPSSSGFEIHYLSSLAGVAPVVCTQCPLITIPCQPVVNPCMPLAFCKKDSMDSDCDSCQ